ncbi:hypothetical protein [Chondromyces crocatus]|nr:hypothetical protein [Chondromyces crocatus]
MQRLKASAVVEQYQRQAASLSQLEAQMRRLQSANVVNIDKYRELKSRLEAARTAVARLSQEDSVKAFLQMRDAINAKRQSVASAQAEFVQLGGTFGKTNQSAKEANGGLGELMETAQMAGGPVGSLAGRAGQLKAMLGKGGATGALVVLIAALAALTVGLGVAAASLAAFALQAAGAARASRLLLDAATGSAAAGGALAGQIDAVAGRVALTHAQLEEMALSLARTRLEGQGLASALSAVAMASSVMGTTAGAKLQGIAEQAARARRFVVGAFDLDGTGLKLDDVAGALAERLGLSFSAAVAAIQNGQVRVEHGLQALDDAIQKKFGHIARAQLLGLSFQLQRAREDFSRLFGGVHIDPLLQGLRGVLRLLDQSTISGRALKVLAEAILNPLFASLSRGAPYARAFFQGMVIGALLVAIAVLRVKKALDSVFGSESTSKVDGLRLAMLSGAAALGALLGLVVVLSIPFVFLGTAIYRVYSEARALYAVLSGLDFGSIATNLLAGLVNGIEGGASWVLGAVRNLADRMMGTIKSALGIASPSKVFALYGRFTGEGLVQGIEASQPDVDSAVSNLVSIPSAEGPAVAGASIRNQQGGNTYNITIHGVKDAEQLKSPSFLAQLAAALEGAALAGGIPLEPEMG